MKLNTIVVDDSSIQRITIAKLISEHPNLVLGGDFSNALEAKNYITNNTVDLIFLDIEMPHITGFDLIDGLKIKPLIVFITSKADYALKAFDYSALDFLQKHITTQETIFDLGVPNPFSKIMEENGYTVKNTTGEDLDNNQNALQAKPDP